MHNGEVSPKNQYSCAHFICIFCYIDLLWSKVAKVCSRRLIRSWEVTGLNLYPQICYAERFLVIFLRLHAQIESLKLQYLLFSYRHPGAFRPSSSQGLIFQYRYKTCNSLKSCVSSTKY